MNTKWSDNEEEQEQYMKEARERPVRIKQEKIWDEEIRQEEIDELRKKQKKIAKETARLWKKRRNRRDYLLQHKEKTLEMEKIADEIFALTYMLNRKHKKENYRTSTDACFCVNRSFKGCVKHHIDKNTVICIPRELHELVRHNLKTGKGMKEMNENTFRWLRHKITSSTLLTKGINR